MVNRSSFPGVVVAGRCDLTDRFSPCVSCSQVGIRDLTHISFDQIQIDPELSITKSRAITITTISISLLSGDAYNVDCPNN